MQSVATSESVEGDDGISADNLNTFLDSLMDSIYDEEDAAAWTDDDLFRARSADSLMSSCLPDLFKIAAKDESLVRFVYTLRVVLLCYFFSLWTSFSEQSVATRSANWLVVEVEALVVAFFCVLYVRETRWEKEKKYSFLQNVF